MIRLLKLPRLFIVYASFQNPSPRQKDNAAFNSCPGVPLFELFDICIRMGAQLPPKFSQILRKGVFQEEANAVLKLFKCHMQLF